MNTTDTMTADEIQTQVLCGSHKTLKAFFAPLMEQVAEILGSCPTAVSYSGTGGVRVTLEADNFKSTLDCWKTAWAAARVVRNALPETYRVSKPKRATIDGGTFRITRDYFIITLK